LRNAVLFREKRFSTPKVISLADLLKKKPRAGTDL